MLTKEELVVLLKRMVGESSQKKVANELRISPQYLNDIIRYRRSAGRKVCMALGIQKVIMYKSLYIPEL